MYWFHFFILRLELLVRIQGFFINLTFNVNLSDKILMCIYI